MVIAANADNVFRRLCAAMGSPDATSVVRVLAFSVIISGAVAAPAALLQREFRAGRRMLIEGRAP